MENICRLCLDPTNNEKVSLISDIKHHVLSASGILYQNLINVPITFQDSVRFICKKCNFKLNVFSEFQTQGYESFLKLCENKFIQIDEQIENSFDEMKNISRTLEIEEINLPFKKEEYEEVQYLEENDLEIEQLLNHEDEQDETTDILDADNNVGLNETSEIISKKKNKDQLQDKIFSCKYCSEVFTKKYHLGKHRKTVHPRETFFCDLCDKKFFSSEMLDAHSNVHNGLPAYQCELCEKTFNQKSNYNYHILGHKNIRNSTCHLCGKGFLGNSDLSIHLRIHNDERRYKCDICGKRFRAHTHMKNHRYSHFDKILKCQICLQSYSSPSTLQTHIKSVHELIYPYECIICKKKFKRKHHLTTHEKTHEKSYEKMLST